MEELETRQERDPQPLRQSVLEWAEVVVGSVVVVTLLLTFLCRIITVDGSSMNPTYENGDRVLVTNLAGPVEQGDVVIVVNALEEPIIKRVVATQGQVVDFDPALGEVTVDGEPLYGETFGIANGITYVPDLPGEVLEFPQTVPEGCVFVLGDNRSVSEDSRYQRVGMIDRRNILGKAVLRLFPLNRIGLAN